MLPQLVSVLVVILIAGLILWAMEQFSLDETMCRIVRVVIIVFVCVWLIYLLIGFLPAGPSFSYRR